MGIHESFLVSTRGIQSATIFKKYNSLAQINFYKNFFFLKKKKISPKRGYSSRARKLMQNAHNPISTIHNEESCVMNIPAKFQLNRTTNALIKDGQNIQILVFETISLFLFGGSFSFAFSYYSLFAITNDTRFCKPYPKYASPYGFNKNTHGLHKFGPSSM